MNEQQIQTITDVTKDIAKDVYADGLKPVVQETGGILSTVVGFFNNVVLYPVKKANINFKYKLEKFEDDLKGKITNIPPERLVEPPLMISGPTLEALKYTYDVKELREMYLNLLASAMDIDQIPNTHPAFVEIIRQLSPLDANILKKIKDLHKSLACIKLQFFIDGGAKIYNGAMPNIFCEDLCTLGDPFLVATSICNLERLGLINVDFHKWFNDDVYQKSLSNSYVKERVKIYESLGKAIDVKHTEPGIISLTDLSRDFIKVCMD